MTEVGDSMERWVATQTPLVPEEPIDVELTAHAGAKVTLLDVDDTTAFVLVTAFATSEDSDGKDPLMAEPRHVKHISEDSLIASLPMSALVAVARPLQAPEIRADARDQDRLLYGNPEATGRGVKLSCGPVEILATLQRNVQMLRQIHEGFELRGFTRVPIEWSWDDNSCFQRVTRTSGRSGFTPPVPPNQVRVSQSDAQRASKYVTSGRTLFEMQSNDTSGLVCAKVNYRRGELKKTALEGIGAARREVSYGAYFAETGSGELRGPSVKKYDERGKKIHGVAYGCLAFVQLVNDTPSTLELVTANDVIAYHPDDVTRWYKTKAACEDAIKNKPRVRLSPDQRGVAALTPPRLFRGC